MTRPWDPDFPFERFAARNHERNGVHHPRRRKPWPAWARLLLLTLYAMMVGVLSYGFGVAVHAWGG